jgi:hypothetical protein
MRVIGVSPVTAAADECSATIHQNLFSCFEAVSEKSGIKQETSQGVSGGTTYRFWAAFAGDIF